MPAAGDKGRILSEHSRPGGQVATATLGVARLGLRAALIAAVGADEVADEALAPLEREGVDLGQVQRVSGCSTRRALVLVEAASGERSVLESRDAQLRIDPDGDFGPCVQSARVLLVDVTSPEAARKAARLAREAGGAVLLDADATWDQPEALLRWIDFPVVPRVLAEEFGKGSVERGLEWIASFGARLAVATLGDEGSLACGSATEGALVRSPAFHCALRDSTGAGDAFRAGFAFGLCRGWSVGRVLAAANATASLNCEGRGAQEGLPGLETLEQRLEQWQESGEGT